MYEAIERRWYGKFSKFSRHRLTYTRCLWNLLKLWVLLDVVFFALLIVGSCGMIIGSTGKRVGGMESKSFSASFFIGHVEHFDENC